MRRSSALGSGDDHLLAFEAVGEHRHPGFTGPRAAGVQDQESTASEWTLAGDTTVGAHLRNEVLGE
jgi:hypothetical protein